ncbi:MAG: hypothetical protein U1E53_20065 [Dongiaceae bacterium]
MVFRRLAVAGLAAALIGSWAAGARAASGDDAPANKYKMNSNQFQGVSCILGGFATAGASYIYSDVVAVAATGAVTNPVLTLPILAAGFAAGCGVFATMAPGLYWMYEMLGGPTKPATP